MGRLTGAVAVCLAGSLEHCCLPRANLKNIFVSPHLTLLKREGSVGR